MLVIFRWNPYSFSEILSPKFSQKSYHQYYLSAVFSIGFCVGYFALESLLFFSRWYFDKQNNILSFKIQCRILWFLIYYFVYQNFMIPYFLLLFSNMGPEYLSLNIGIKYRIKTKILNLGLVPQPWIKTTQHTYKIFKNYFILL